MPVHSKCSHHIAFCSLFPFRVTQGVICKMCWKFGANGALIGVRSGCNTEWKLSIKCTENVCVSFRWPLIPGSNQRHAELRAHLDWEAWKSWSWSRGLWFCSATMACKACLWTCRALLYKKTPMKTMTVPMALRAEIWLLKTMMLIHTDRACFTVLATLRSRGVKG